MTIGKNILKAKYINFPQHYKELPLQDLTYKWDNVSVEEWTNYADEKGKQSVSWSVSYNQGI